MANNYYTHTTYPAANSQGASAGMRGELAAIMAGFDLLPDPLGVGLKGFSDGRWEGATIVGGTMDGVAIGGVAPDDAAFLNLAASGAISLGIPTAKIAIQGTAAVGGTPAFLTEYANSQRFIGTSGAFDMQFATNNVVRGAVNSAGRWLLGGLTDDAATVVQVNGTFKASGAAAFGSSLNIAGALTASAFMELGSTTTATSPFIDFHSNGTATDYDGRIVVSGGTGTVGQGTMSLLAAAIALGVRPTFAGSVPWDHSNLPAPASLTGGNFSGNITLVQAATTSPALVLNANGYAPWIRSNNTAPGYLEFINSASTRVNLSIRDDGYASFANGAAFALRPTWQGGATPWDNTNLNVVSQLANNVGYLTGGGTIQNAINANNANAVGGIAFQYTAIGGQPTYAWGTNGSAGSNFLTNPAGWSVNFANSAGSVAGVSSPATRGASGVSTGIGAEIGPLTKNSGTSPLDAPSPWVMGGVRVGGWLSNNGDCIGILYVRLTQVQQQ